jgi:hypothetical protein
MSEQHSPYGRASFRDTAAVPSRAAAHRGIGPSGLADPADFASTAHRREQISEQVRRWCERAYIGEREIGGTHPDLSDDAAVLIAAGYLDEETRQILVARRRSGKTIPSVGGFAELRLVSDEHTRGLAKLREARSAGARALLRLRANELARTLRDLRATVVVSDKHYAKSLRATRRERRDGIHLDLDRRDALFEALRRTQAPSLRRTPADLVGRSFGAFAERLADLAEPALRGAAPGHASSPPPSGRGRTTARSRAAGSFADRYDTLLYLAGNLYDRISNSAAWHSDHFAVQRAQLGLPEELTQISVDTAALRMIVAELNAALEHTRDAATAAHIRSRFETLVPVWDQLVERVSALARIGDLLTLAEERLRSINVVKRAMSVDGRIDELIARSGLRELSAANTHQVGDQFSEVDAAMSMYQALLGGDIAALTSRALR